MKKIIFISDSLNSHGAAKALVSLLKKLDPKKYSISLFLLDMEEMFYKKDLPEYVTILPADPLLQAFSLSICKCIPALLRRRQIKALYYRVFISIGKSKKIRLQRYQRYWTKIIYDCPDIPGIYDVAISYNDYYPGVFMLQKVTAGKYIGWNHSVYENMGYSNALYRSYINTLDYIATISEITKASLFAAFGFAISNKVKIVPNIVSEMDVISMSSKKERDSFFSDNRLKIVSVGRLSEEKGFDMALVITTRLKKQGLKFAWYIIGDGPERGNIQRQIKKYSLENMLILLGNKENPYPYIYGCDIYAQPSRYEGYGIAIDEAWVLRKPIIATNNVSERFKNGINAILLPFDLLKWEIEMKRLILSKKLRKHLVDNLPAYPSERGLSEFEQLIMD